METNFKDGHCKCFSWELITWLGMTAVAKGSQQVRTADETLVVPPGEKPAPIRNLKGGNWDCTHKVADMGQHIYKHIKYSYKDGVEAETVTSLKL